jgi:hypothetical protein
MTEYRLENWSVYADPYMPPEAGIRLHGMRTGDPNPTLTSYVKSIEGRRITTQSGNVYVLGEPKPEYLQWMVKHGFMYDPEHPIKDKRAFAKQEGKRK